MWIVGKPPSSSSHIAPYKSYGIHLDYDDGIMTPGMVLATEEAHDGVNTGENINTNQWYHIVGVYDGSFMRIYQNGVFKQQLSWTENLGSFNSPLRIGANGGYDEAFSGLIDELGIWNRALTATEISQLYNGNSGLSYPFSTSTSYTLATSVTPSGAGTVTLSPSGGSYASDSAVTVTATANTGYTFIGWEGALSGSVNTGSINMNSNKSITAKFASTGGGGTTDNWSRDGNNLYFASGNVGIGTNTPSSLLHIRTQDPKIGFTMEGDNTIFNITHHAISLVGKSNFNHVPYLEWIAPNGLRQAYFGWNPDVFSLKLENNFNFSIIGGNVGIGTANPSEPLTVNGKILAKEVEVVSSIASDFVFEPEYKLMPLTDLEIYLKQNKHLPGIPSAKEFEQQGQNLGKMDDLLLRKIEELTLYILDLKKENQELKLRLNNIEMKNMK